LSSVIKQVQIGRGEEERSKANQRECIEHMEDLNKPGDKASVSSEMLMCGKMD
jgi:hypothetical protein